jgi:hypothetical protein
MRSRPALSLCIILLVLVLAGVVGAARAQALDFRLSHHATGLYPKSVAVGDFNNDGNPDLVTANGLSDTVSVLLGNGSGGFAARLDAATGDYPVSVAVADFNKDGKQDVVTANPGRWDAPVNTVSVLLGNGAGGFVTKTDFATDAGPGAVAVADFNNDGKPDVATANSESSTVSVLLGDGAGGFAAKSDVATGAGPNSITVADFDKDGKRDLATANADANTVSVLLGNGAGGFAAKIDFATGDSPQSVATGDLNKDGMPDLVASNWSGYTVGVRLGDGSGGFGSRTDFTIGAGMFYIRSVVIVDLDNDGKPDVATSNHTRTYSPFPPHAWQFDYSGVFVRLGNGDGTLAGGNGLGEQRSFPTDYGPLALAAADLNGDGRKDLVTANYEANTISVLLQPQSSLKDVTVGNPVAPGVMYKGKAKTVYGSLNPRHTAGTSPVEIYRWKKSAGGAWKSYSPVKARVADYSTYSRFSRALSFPAKGKWRIRAYHPACSLHVAKWSAEYDYVTVK